MRNYLFAGKLIELGYKFMIYHLQPCSLFLEKKLGETLFEIQIDR